ncbi:Zn-dependent peptidase ImmA (M78 family) [Lactobacillus colini]|uniref:Zn-dependent peptidase ImmA (M78 family) n=1 Tax=Lactobacillus colini TaxID=1819254 RepID=A0ABS4MF68_9LACO|nr:hypothetical protein [Lactobacillus colini]MBP2058335.1 Zn-dependent peptidase ImmA (M78 family) [Lactobacillus colini]
MMETINSSWSEEKIITYFFNYSYTWSEIKLILYLLDFAQKQKIGYVLYQANAMFPSFSFKEGREIGINLNWHNHSSEVPFTIGHEIGHIMSEYRDTKRLNYCRGVGTQITEEMSADIYSLQLLYKYSSAQEDNFYDPLNFIRAYGVPKRMINETYKLFASEEGFFFKPKDSFDQFIIE